MLTASTHLEKLILLIRGQRVMLDSALAALYGVKTKELNRAMKRNMDRFPDDFVFLLTTEEADILRFQFGTSSELDKHGGRRYLPHVFTEQGVAMLSSVLRSKRAVLANVEIMRTFVKLRHILGSHKDLARKLSELEGRYDRQFKIVFDAIRQIMDPPTTTRKQIGFKGK